MADLILACPREGHAPFAAERLRRAALRLAPPEVPPREPLLLESDGVVAVAANPTAEGVFLRGGEEESGDRGDGRRPVRRRPLRRARLVVAGRRAGPRRHLRARPLGRGRRRAAQRRLRLAHALVRAHRGRLPRLHLAARPGDAAGQLRARAGGDRLLPLLGHPGAGRSPGTRACGACRRTRASSLDRGGVARHAPRGALRAQPGRGRRRERTSPVCATRSPPPAAASTSTSSAGSCRSPAATTAGRCSPFSSPTACDHAASPGRRAASLRTRSPTPRSRACCAPAPPGRARPVVSRRRRPRCLSTALIASSRANEGRNDEIAGYLDGFALWRDLAAGRRPGGVIRGDESYGPRRR